MSRQVTIAILGAGARGNMVSQWAARNAHLVRVVAVADVDPVKRGQIAARHDLPEDRQFETYQQLFSRPRMADAVFNMLMDRLHLESSVMALEKGYHMLLEKPVAPTLEACVAIEKAAREAGTIVAVCHNMRHSPLYLEVKRLLDSGAIGRLVSFEQCQALNPLHQAHSYVRGNWGNEARSASMLLTKACHDLDLLAWLVGRPCRQVSSFGSLTHFRAENCPPGAPQRCADGCPHEPDCMYSAIKLYATPNKHWYVDALGIRDVPQAQAMEVLKTSPYGRCVYQCDNDVVDHQVAAMEFDRGVTGTFTMTGFALQTGLRLYGTGGCILVDQDRDAIRLHRYADEAVVDMVVPQGESLFGIPLFRNFVEAVARNDPAAVTTGLGESVRSHKIAFAAERSRREGRTVRLEELA